MAKAKNYPTPEQDAEFDGYVLKWQKALNLMDWRIERGPTRAKRAMANVALSHGDRMAVYRTGCFGQQEITPRVLESTALHEVVHVFVSEFRHLTAQEKTDPEVLESAEHRIVITLEKLLLKD